MSHLFVWLKAYTHDLMPQTLQSLLWLPFPLMRINCSGSHPSSFRKPTAVPTNSGESKEISASDLENSTLGWLDSELLRAGGAEPKLSCSLAWVFRLWKWVLKVSKHLKLVSQTVAVNIWHPNADLLALSSLCNLPLTRLASHQEKQCPPGGGTDICCLGPMPLCGVLVPSPLANSALEVTL